MSTLGERIKELRLARKETQQQLADAIGTSKSSVSQWESGLTKKMDGENLARAASHYHVNALWLSTGKGGIAEDCIEGYVIRERLPEPIQANAIWHGEFDVWDNTTPIREDEVALPFFREVQLSAGKGISEVQENHGARLRFAKSTLKRKGISAADAACVVVSGNSMEPVLPDGSTIGIDTSKTDIINGKMYAIDHDGQLRVKMIYQLPGGGLRLRSFNTEEWPDEPYPDTSKIRILGQVFWSSVLW